MADPGEIYTLTHGATTDGTLKYQGVDWSWFTDNTSSYTNVTQLIYIINQNQNSQATAVWSRAFLAIPWTISMTGMTADVAGSATFKSGYWHMIESFNIQFCGISVNNLCKLSNMAIQIRTLLNADPLRLSQSLPQRGFFLDTPETNTFLTSGGKSFFANNIISTSNSAVTAAGVWTTLFPTSNLGLLKRVIANNWEPDGTVMTQAQAGNLHMSNSWFNANTQYVSGIAIINLYDLSDFFSERNLGFPLKNGSLNLTVNVNQGSATYTKATQVTSLSSFTNQTCPIQVTDAGNTNMSGATSVLTLSLGQYGSSGTPSQVATRFYLPQVSVSPTLELKLPTSITRKITFRDFMQFTSTPYGAASSITWNISNSIPGLKRLFIVPLLSATVQPSNLPSYGNLTSSCPGMMDTNLFLGNIALTLSGRNLSQNNILYNYEQWFEFQESETLNGGACAYTAGSLFNLPNWQRGYGVYVFDCTRTLNLQKVEPNSPISATLIATNNSQQTIDILVWAEVEVSVDLSQSPVATYAG